MDLKNPISYLTSCFKYLKYYCVYLFIVVYVCCSILTEAYGLDNIYVNSYMVKSGIKCIDVNTMYDNLNSWRKSSLIYDDVHGYDEITYKQMEDNINFSSRSVQLLGNASVDSLYYYSPQGIILNDIEYDNKRKSMLLVIPLKPVHSSDDLLFLNTEDYTNDFKYGFVVATLTERRGSYIANNAYGATVLVSTYVGEELCLEIVNRDRRDRFSKRNIWKDDELLQEKDMFDVISGKMYLKVDNITKSEYNELTNNIGFVLVFKLAYPFVNHGGVVNNNPTWKHPEEYDLKQNSLKIFIEKVVVYNKINDNIVKILNATERHFKVNIKSHEYKKKKRFYVVSPYNKILNIYDDSFNFSNGFARVKRNGKWGLMDEYGKVAVDTKYDYIWDYDGKFSKVRLGNGTIMFIDSKGNIVGGDR